MEGTPSQLQNVQHPANVALTPETLQQSTPEVEVLRASFPHLGTLLSSSGLPTPVLLPQGQWVPHQKVEEEMLRRLHWAGLWALHRPRL